MKIKSRANKLYQKALEFYSKGNCKKLLNNYKGAIADFTMAIKYNPNFAEAYFKRANTKLILNDSKGAQNDFDKAIELKPYFAEALLNRGITKLNNGNFEDSKKDFLKAGKLGLINAFSIRKELYR
ncbi:MAG TPA: tetratricopeptide repeat protein [Ignavibacteriaceae bacterium]|nr:tetratricopeptide repeat protein [Ignavibacteriaceae bacterium]